VLVDGGAPVVLAEVLEVALPLLRPFVTSFGATSTRRTVLVHIQDEQGCDGWGEAPALDHPFYLPDTASGAFALISEYALPLALGTGPGAGPHEVAAALSSIRGNPFARAGVEAAWWALAAGREGLSLREVLGGMRERVPVGQSVGIHPSLDATVEEVMAGQARGYRRVKLKVKPGWDLEVVAAVRSAIGDEVMLQVDANGSYTLDDVDRLRQLDRYGLACIEQPLGWDQLLAHAELQRHIATPVCLDECLRSVGDVRLALDLGACRNVNLKPARVGGLSAALAVHDLCREAGVPLWCGGMLESGIGRAGNLALCSLPGFTDPADMSPASELFEHDLVDPTYRVDPDGCIAVPDLPGLGFPVRADRVEAATIRKMVVEPPGRRP
jgi:O-succinylbenzoate synthase